MEETEKIMKAAYRKLNDGSHSSSTYHKKDGTPVRSILKNDMQRTKHTRFLIID